MLDVRTRGWRFQNVADDAEAREWVQLAFGDEAAALPPELRAHVYGDVQVWGPAGEQVVAFLAALNSVLLTAPSEDGGDVGVPLRALAAGVTAGGMGLREWVTNVRRTTHLQSALKVACSSLKSKPLGVFQGAWVVVWMLNGQFMFTAEEVAGEAKLVRRVNGILTGLGLPELGGVFAGAVSSGSQHCSGEGGRGSI